MVTGLRFGRGVDDFEMTTERYVNALLIAVLLVVRENEIVQALGA